MGILYYVYWGYCVVAALAVTLASLYYVNKLQRLSYNAGAYAHWVKERFTKDAFPLILVGVMSILLKISNIFFIRQIPVLSYICFYGADILFLYMLLSLYFAYKKESVEDPLKKEGVAIRALVLVFLLSFLCEANLMRETEYYGSVTWVQYMTPYVIGYLPAMLVPLLVLVSVCITSPHLAFKKAGPGLYADETLLPEAAPALQEAESGMDAVDTQQADKQEADKQEEGEQI